MLNKGQVQLERRGENPFMEMNKIEGQDILLSHPNFSEEFIIHIDAIKKKLGEVIIQYGNPIDSYSHKLTHAQINDKTTET